MTLESLGFDTFFETESKNPELSDFSVARVVSEHRGAYWVKDATAEYYAKITGRQMFKATSREDFPAVGDFVALTKLDNAHAVINAILPRKTLLKRKGVGEEGAQVIAANLDFAFVVESVDRDYNLNRIERYFALIREGKITPTIILNKIDLLPRENLEAKLVKLQERFPGIGIFTTSTVSGQGLDTLRQYFQKGKTYCFLGSSGVGKSSLLNKLLGAEVIKTAATSESSGRGKHITTRREMFFLENGGMVIDNPGMREVGLADSREGIDSLFDEISALASKCKFADCTHVHEPGCAVILAVNSGLLDKGRYFNYLNLKKEDEFYQMTKLQRRQKDKKFGKFVKVSLNELKKFD